MADDVRRAMLEAHVAPAAAPLGKRRLERDCPVGDIAAVGRLARSARLHGRAGDGRASLRGDVGDAFGGC